MTSLTLATEQGKPLNLPLDAFVRSVEVNRNSPHTFFLGAGASVSSGIQTAYQCIWEWKRKIFLSNNPGLARQFADLSISSTKQRIQDWLDNENRYPHCDAPEEYSIYVEHCYPIPQDRRQFFEELTKGAKPHIGYQLLCLLAKAGIIKAVWSTNFDGLSARATAATDVIPIEAGLDSVLRVVRPPQNGELLCVALHGDYRYDLLKNTALELQAQDADLRNALIAHLTNTTLIVSGYSGRDASILEALTAAYSCPGTGRLYWCGRDECDPPPVVRQLIELARSNEREAYFIPTNGFDDLLVRLASTCLKDDLHARAQNIYAPLLGHSDHFCPPFNVDASHAISVIRSNAFVVDCPSEVLYFESETFKCEGAWSLLRECIEGHEVLAAVMKDGVMAIGKVDDVKALFQGKITSGVERTPVGERELSIPDSHVISLFTQALVRAIAAARGLQTDGKRLVWMPAPYERRRIYGEMCQVYQAAVLFLRRYAGKQYLVIKPTVRGTTASGEKLSEDQDRELKRAVLTRQWNKQFNEATKHWCDRIFANGSVFEYPAASDSNFKFSISTAPAFARIGGPKNKRAINVPTKFQSHLTYDGFEYQEPSLLFSNRRGDGIISETNPVRGITQHRPYDFALTRDGLHEQVRLGVVCPETDAPRFSEFLNKLHIKVPPTSNAEYLLEYPGFATAFGLPLDIPAYQHSAWAACPEPDPLLSEHAGAAELSRYITECIQAVKACSSVNVIVVFIPQRWRRWLKYSDEKECFDLHDFIKAYCVQRGIATQFIEEDTLTKEDQCGITWWLALSFYVKSMRTPWVLDAVDQSTAFMGIGYSLDSAAQRGKQVILGCSHIYSSEGVGLRYRLTKLESPVFLGRRKNPFMSRDDARSLGDGVRQLFSDSGQLPKRVVIHKRTPFLKQEREGLLEGLAGIDCVEMLEVDFEPALRYVASRFVDGKFQEDAFPLRRGTTVVIEKRKALVWVHGTTPSTSNEQRNYYLGKSRIPAPLVLIRHHGTSSLSVLARELLGLSKMNWNTFDMYTKLPATIESSNEIARIGSLLARFGAQSYDYRLII